MTENMRHEDDMLILPIQIQELYPLNNKNIPLQLDHKIFKHNREQTEIFFFPQCQVTNQITNELNINNRLCPQYYSLRSCANDSN